MLPVLLTAAAAFAQDAAPAIHPALQAVRGRKIWMVGAPPEDCARVERELGLVVDCDTDWETSQDEVVIWCTEIPHEVGPAILEYLGRSHAAVRTHQTNPAAGGTGECGQLFEITVRYPNATPEEEIIHNSTLLQALGSGNTELAGILSSGDGSSSGHKKLFGDGGSYASSGPDADVLAAIRGRKIWMVRAPESECARVERELGLVVDCDPNWNALASEEIVIWCTEIPHAAAPALLRALGKESFEVRTHQTNPAAAGTGECGESFEITVRY